MALRRRQLLLQRAALRDPDIEEAQRGDVEPTVPMASFRSSNRYA
jgi:hypothetical protein